MKSKDTIKYLIKSLGYHPHFYCRVCKAIFPLSLVVQHEKICGDNFTTILPEDIKKVIKQIGNKYEKK